jgi:hypothetical protein
MGALPSLFFSQKVLLEALSFLFFVPKATRSDLAAESNAIKFGWAAKYFHFFLPL